MASSTIVSDLKVDVESLNQQLNIYNSLLGNLGKEAAIGSKRQEELAEQLQRSFDHIKAGNGNFRQHIALIQDAKTKMKDLAAQNKQVELTMKLVAFATDDFGTKLTKTVGKLQQMGKGLQGMANFLSGSNGALGSLQAVKAELQAFNQSMFVVSRQAQIMGRNPVITGETWKSLRENTTLARSEFVKFSAEMNRSMLGVPMTAEKMVKSIERFQKAFGQIEWEQQFKRIHVEMQNTLPGFSNWIESAKAMSEAGNFKKMGGDIKDMAMAMHALGADTRQVEAMYSYLNDTIKEQDALMSYDTAIKKRQQAIKDMNLAMGKNSEQALIAIEKSMTKLVSWVDKLVNSLSIIPTIMMSMSAIGLSSITSLIGGMKTLNAETRSVVGNFGRMKGVIGMGGTAMALGTAGLSYMNASQAASGATGMGAKYRTGIEKSNAGRNLAFTTGGAVIGGILGSIIPGAGTAVGAMAGSTIGGLAGNFFGQKKVDERFAGALSAMETLKGSKEFENFRIGAGSEKDLARTISGQQTLASGGDKEAAKRRDMMIAALRRAGYDEKKMKEMGLAVALKANQAEKDRLESIKEQVKSEFERYRKYVEMEKQMQKMVALTKEMAASYESMSQFQMGFGAGAGEAMQQKRVSALKESYIAATKALEEFQANRGKEAFSMASFEQSGIGEKLSAGGATSDDIAKFRGALSKGNMEQVRAMAEQFNVSKEILDNDVLRLKALEKTVLKNREVKLEEEKIAALKNLEKGRVDAVAYYYEEQAKTTGELLDLQSKMTKFVESTAAGIAASFQMRRKEYDLTKEQRKIYEKGEEAVVKSNADRLKGLMKDKDAMAELKRAGVEEGMLNRLVTGTPSQKAAAMKHIQEMIRGNEKLAGNEALRAMSAGLEKEIEMRKKVIDLKTKEVQLAIALKEGYLDVINEMTTGSDLVSKLLPDAQRGIVALHRVQRQITGDEMGGALTRGFVSVNAFRGSMDIGGAAKYTQQGFFSGNLGSTASRAYRDSILMKREKEEADRGGPVRVGDWEKGPIGSGGGRNLRSGAGETSVSKSTGNLATGGVIPGPPSNVDDKRAMIDGQMPIKVASGEYIVNAKQTKKHRGLLEAINRGDLHGFAGGGEVDFAAIKRGDNKAIAGLRKYMMHRGVKSYAQLMRMVKGIKGGLFVDDIESMDELDERIFSIQAGGKHGVLKEGLKEGAGNVQGTVAWSLMNLVDAATGPALTRERKSTAVVDQVVKKISPAIAKKKASSISPETEARLERMMTRDRNLLANAARSDKMNAEVEEALMGDTKRRMRQYEKRYDAMTERGKYYDGKKRDWEVVVGGKSVYNENVAGAIAHERGNALNEALYGTSDPKVIASMNAGLTSDLQGYATGGIAKAGGVNSLSVSGGLRIGVLSLNGKVIGQDVSGGLGDEWKIASQNANG